MTETEAYDLKFEFNIEGQTSQSENIHVKSLSLVVKEALEFTTILAQNHLKNEDQELPNGSISYENFNSPMGILKKILCKVSCTDEKNEYSGNQEKTSVLDDLLPEEKFSVGRRVLLTLAAFALQYSEFWFYFETWNEFSEAMGSLRRIDDLKKHVLDGKCKEELIKLNDMVKERWNFIDQIIKLDTVLTSRYKKRNLPDLEEARRLLEHCSQIATETLLDCMIQLAALINHRTVELHFSLSISEQRDTFKKLEGRDAICKRQIEENEKYLNLLSVFQNCTGIKEVIWSFTDSNSKNMLFDCDSKKMISVDEVVKETKILLFISSLKINGDISDLTDIYEELKEKHYRIIWIPAVENWEKEKTTFDDLKKEMTWYTVVHPAGLEGIIRYAREKWKFNNMPIVVSIDEKGSLNCRVEFRQIKALGIEAFPFSEQQYTIVQLFPGHKAKKEDYTFIYGGTDENWIEEFRKCVDDAASKCAGARISIKGLQLENNQKDLENFWAKMELWLEDSMKNNLIISSKATLKLFSLKYETSWALLLKESTVSVSGRGKTILDALQSFEWNKDFSRTKFEDLFLKHHKSEEENSSSLPCVRFDANTFYNLPGEPIECHCDRPLKKVTILCCCHGKQIDNWSC